MSGDGGKKRFLGNAYANRTTGEVRDYYDQWSEVYDEELAENNYQQPRRCAEALSRMLKDTGARVLDVGCGTGLSGVALADAGFSHVDGCDLSTGMLEKAFATGAYTKLFTADLNRPPLDAPDGEYGGIAAVGVFSFGHVQADALEEFMRVSQPGAPIIIGLNDHFYEEGSLISKIVALEKDGRLSLVEAEKGEHLPGIGLTGWVLSLTRL
ncbi:MAG: methyltransferase domain-containing protein [Rhizobiaceae bacterium]